MTGQLEPDLTDPEVFALLLGNHVPYERIVALATRADGQVEISGHDIICEKDHERWPCRIRLLLENTVPSRMRYQRFDPDREVDQHP